MNLEQRLIFFVNMLRAEAWAAQTRLDGAEAKAYNRGYTDALDQVIEYAEEQED